MCAVGFRAAIQLRGDRVGPGATDRLVLVADDDGCIRDLVSAVLEQELGTRSLLAEDGREALRLLGLCESVVESPRVGCPFGTGPALSAEGRPGGPELICPRATEARMPDLVVTDVKMPNVDGVELIGRLRGCAASRGVPILVVAASKASRDRAMAAGGSDYLDKPFDIDALVTKVQRYLAS